MLIVMHHWATDKDVVNPRETAFDSSFWFRLVRVRLSNEIRRRGNGFLAAIRP